MISRRQLLKTSLLGLASGSLLSISGCKNKSEFSAAPFLHEEYPDVAQYLKTLSDKKLQPNILMLVLDDAGWGDLGCYKNQIADTPNMDRLAHEGVKFERFHAGSPVCGPSRVCLLTGRNPAHVGVTANFNPQNLKLGLNTQNSLSADTNNILQIFKKAGYQTGFFGKAHFGRGNKAVSMKERGADRFFGWHSSSRDVAEFKKWVAFKGKEIWPEPMQSVYKNGGEDKNRLRDEKITAEALKFMQGNKSPWFVSINFYAPHAPLDPRIEDRDAIKGGAPYWSRKDEKLWGPDQIYYGALRSIDRRCIGPMLDWLDASGQRDNTIVVLTSDNGAMRPTKPSHAIFSSGYNGGYAGWKSQLSLGSLRIPFIVSWPKYLARNAVSTQSGYFADVLPTLAALANIDVSGLGELDGENIAHALVSSVELPRKKPIYYYYPKVVADQMNNSSPVLSMLSPDTRWFFQCDSPRSVIEGPERAQLYFLPDDPGQVNNLYNPSAPGERGEISNLMRDELLAWAGENLPKNWANFQAGYPIGRVWFVQPEDAYFPVE